MTKTVDVPLERIQKRLPIAGQWLDPAHQGPGGLYAVRRIAQWTNHPPMYQACRIETAIVGGDSHKINTSRDISEPWMTPQGAHRFAEKLAGGAKREAD